MDTLILGNGNRARNKIFVDRGSLNSEVNFSEKDYINLEILHQKLVSKLSDSVADQ